MTITTCSRIRYFEIFYLFSRINMGLVYEWTFDNTTLDDVQCVPLTPIGNVPFVKEGDNNYSIYITNGSYLTAPSGYYFTDAFTITSWVYILQFASYARVLDFGNGQQNCNVVLSYCQNMNQQVYMEVLDGTVTLGTMSPTNGVLNLSQWTHVTTMFNENHVAYFYLNGSYISQAQFGAGSINVLRTQNYVGKSSSNDGNTYAKFRKLRIYNQTLNVYQIQNDMNT